jgi:hypothetical protein
VWSTSHYGSSNGRGCAAVEHGLAALRGARSWGVWPVRGGAEQEGDIAALVQCGLGHSEARRRLGERGLRWLRWCALRLAFKA